MTNWLLAVADSDSKLLASVRRLRGLCCCWLLPDAAVDAALLRPTHV